MKTCTKCGIEKDDDDFPFRDKNKGVRRNECKLCTKEYRENYYTQNRQVLLEDARQYYASNKDKIIEDVKSYRKENKDTIGKYKREYYQDNKHRIKEYQILNKNRIQKSVNEQRKERRKNDPSFRVRIYISNSIRDVLKGRKDNGTWKNLPYTPQQLKEHLENQFEPWMNWNNQGMYDRETWNDNDSSTWTWQMDHIIPQSLLPYVSMQDDNFKKCWSLENLRPLSAKQNIIEGADRSRHR
jgi:hypothetical protein